MIARTEPSEMLRKVGRRTAERLIRVRAFRNTLRGLALRGLIPDWAWRRLPAPAEFEVRDPNRQWFKYKSADGDRFARRLFWRGPKGFEPETMAEFLRSARTADVVVDVGANVGVYTLYALAQNPNVEVIAFEPIPRVADLLARNLELNDWSERVKLHRAAAADVDGEAEFVDPAIAVPSSGRLKSAKYRTQQGDQDQIIMKTVRLDSLIQKDTSVDVIKIDVEGAEDQVLRGASRILERDRPTVFFECHQDGPALEIEGLMARHGYTLARLDASGPTNVDRIDPGPGRQFRNYVASPKMP